MWIVWPMPAAIRIALTMTCAVSLKFISEVQNVSAILCVHT
jgi:hypothetical protein